MKKIIVLIAVLFLPAHSFADAYGVFKDNRKSIVVVTAYNKKGQPLLEGTGFIVNTDGVVITNCHVIGIAKDIKVRTNDGVIDVEGVIYADSENDIVALKVKGKDMPAVKLGDIERTKSGEKVYIISSSKDSGSTIHDGVFRRTRTIPPGKKVIEITAPVSYGSSGSPVFNSAGEVIGITTLLMKRAETFVFAMPVDVFIEGIKSKGPVISIDSIIKNYRNTAEYWFYLGYFLAETGADKEAVDVFKEAIRLKPGFADAYYYRGAAYEKTGNYNEAARDYREAIKLRPDFADAHFSLGVTYGKLGMYKEALEILRQAVRIEPDFADAYYNMGVAYGKLGMYREGIEAGKQAVRLKPDFADAYYNLGLAYEKSGSYPEAAATFQKVLKFRPDYAEAHYNLGLVHLLLKDKGSAIERYNILKAINTELANKLFKLIYK